MALSDFSPTILELLARLEPENLRDIARNECALPAFRRAAAERLHELGHRYAEHPEVAAQRAAPLEQFETLPLFGASGGDGPRVMLPLEPPPVPGVENAKAFLAQLKENQVPVGGSRLPEQVKVKSP